MAKINYFVNKDDKIIVEVYAYQGKTDIEATTNKSNVPSDKDADLLKFTFRKPTYLDSQQITSVAIQPSLGGEIRFDLSALHDMILRNLLVEWSIADDDGTAIEVNTVNLNNLHPVVARAAATKFLESTSIF